MKINWMSEPEKPNYWNMLHEAHIFRQPHIVVCNANLQSQIEEKEDRLMDKEEKLKRKR